MSCSSSPDVSFIFVPTQQRYVAVKVAPIFNVQKEMEDRLDVAWVAHSTTSMLGYLAVSMASVFFVGACFVRQFGNHHPSPSAFGSWLDENALARVVMVEWLTSFAVFFWGCLMFRRVLMPTFLVFSLVATKGTIALFLIKARQVYDGLLPIDDVMFVFLGVLVVLAVVHSCLYLVVIYLHADIQQRIHSRRRSLNQLNWNSNKSPSNSFTHLI